MKHYLFCARRLSFGGYLMYDKKAGLANKMRNLKLYKSFRHALEGIRWVVSHHPNFKIHILFALLAVILSLALKLNRIEWIILILTILFVLIAEMANTAVEEVTNLITIKWAHHAKVAKDVSAGMVLVAAGASVIIGFLLFAPKF